MECINIRYNRGLFLNYPLKEFIQQKCYKDKIQIDLAFKENKKENGLSIENNKEKFFLIKKYLGEELLIELKNFIYLTKYHINIILVIMEYF